MKIRPLGDELFHAGEQTDRQTDRPTDRHDGTNCHFSKFCEGAKTLNLTSGCLRKRACNVVSRTLRYVVVYAEAMSTADRLKIRQTNHMDIQVEKSHSSSTAVYPLT